jgi:putative transcriptional regulator
MITHHPTPELLADYARGALKSGASLIAATHIHNCVVCREEIGFLERVGGILLHDEMPTSLSEDALRNVLKRIDQQKRVDEISAERRIPKYLDRFAIAEPLWSQKIGRRMWVTPNIWFAPVGDQVSDSTRTYLLYARPNTKLSQHTHAGREFTVVLHGAFRDGDDLFGPGDFAETDGAILHSPTATDESDCLCLISADAPMRLTNPIARAIQTVTGRFY